MQQNGQNTAWSHSASASCRVMRRTPKRKHAITRLTPLNRMSCTCLDEVDNDVSESFTYPVSVAHNNSGKFPKDSLNTIKGRR
ncbi:hypothetical protein E2C01_049189 [Portunus trituberculatus]|uniref:Uncharacterized protein n=1 Tax=Portunus trituberculatus TaxID=210409 RepID=A0A5B7GD71_PORTR|nr:hypothetical protein [Portunus trituberculatus]